MDITKLQASIADVDATSFKDEETRLQAVREVQRLLRRIQTPMESTKRVCWIEPNSWVAVRMGIDVNLFDQLCKGSNHVKTTSELASECSVDPVLMGRLLRNLASNDYIEEIAEDKWASTSFSKGLAEQPALRAILRYEGALRPMTRLPEFFRKYGYQNPNFDAHNPWKFGWETDLNLFDWLHAHPEHFKTFNSYMASYAADRPSFAQGYPCPERLFKGFDKSFNDVFIVDVGGGRGHDMMRLVKREPNIPGRIILQDLPQVLASAENLDPKIEKLEYDFFTPQPIRGARTYYLHSVVHDWPDEHALQLLANLTPALIHGYSRVLIHELVVPSTNASQGHTTTDFMMMNVNGSLERTESLWSDLLSRAGLKIVKIWNSPVNLGLQSLIEAELK